MKKIRKKQAINNIKKLQNLNEKNFDITIYIHVKRMLIQQ